MTDFKHTPEQARVLLVQALRSGEYQQVRLALRAGDGFCCLGVACDVFRKAEGIGEWLPGDDVETQLFMAGEDDTAGAVLPLAVKEWLGFLSTHGDLNQHVQYGIGRLSTSLPSLNDQAGYDFNRIADLIEKGGVRVVQE